MSTLEPVIWYSPSPVGMSWNCGRSFSMVSDKSYNVVDYVSVPQKKKHVSLRVTKNKERISREIIKVNFCPENVVFYQQMEHFVVTQDKLRQNSYPMDLPDSPGLVSVTEYLRGSNRSWINEVCSKCKKSFLAFNGRQLLNIPCRYHSGHQAEGEKKYECCGAEVECCRDPCHSALSRSVQYQNFLFEKTELLPIPQHSVYSLDTEMCLTTAGLEVTKVSVIDEAYHIVYDTFVLPKNQIIDYNTQYSGVTAEDLKGVTTILEDVQAVLLSLLDAKTILIGHGLENDLKALRIIHKTVIDTSIIFPDPRGHPYKRSLKSLVSQYLGYNIQYSTKGHDSVEDALACMRLMKGLRRSCQFPPKPPPVYPVYGMAVVPCVIYPIPSVFTVPLYPKLFTTFH